MLILQDVVLDILFFNDRTRGLVLYARKSAIKDKKSGEYY
jgi:hypothetical protein